MPLLFKGFKSPQINKSIRKILLLSMNINKNVQDHTPILDLDLKIEQGCLYTIIYDKSDHSAFPIVNFPFLDWDVHLSPSYGVNISQIV